jgi:F-type H+-transporting ATPase subunit c
VNVVDIAAIRLIMFGLTVAMGGVVPAFAIGRLVAQGLEAIGRNPEAAGEIRTSMILGIAFAEAIAIYALVAGLIIKFV